MRIVAFSLGQLQANCNFLIEDKKCLIIDPADEASFILEELERRRLDLIGMLATHGHFDHIMAVGEIQMSLRVPLHIFKEDLFLVKRLNETAKYFLGYDPQAIKPSNLEYLKEGELKIENWEFKILRTPGHTPGSACFYFEKGKMIFTGDTLFKGAIGRYDFSYSSKHELSKSLEKILRLPDKILVYPGHGETTIIGEERRILEMM